jgi:hypothetical protein
MPPPSPSSGSLIILALIRDTGEINVTLVFNLTLILLIAREIFSALLRLEDLKPYRIKQMFTYVYMNFNLP